MENKPLVRAFIPIPVIFLITNALFLTARSAIASLNIDPDVVIFSNLILFAATCISFYFYSKALRNNNVQVFLRMIYGAMFIKMLICLFAAFIYISSVGKGVNKGAIFASMFLYFLYTFVEIAILMKLSKQQKNA
jgi:hypothetical protein